jgi:fusaric acid resistance family protein
VTGALALESIAATSADRIRHERFLKVADGCDRMRRAFGELRLPAPGEWAALADEQNTEPIIPLIDMERTLDQIALAVPRYSEELSQSGAAPAEKRSLFLPDAFDNPEYVRFAIKGTIAALICYMAFIGFDYPGIYTSVITCFVVALSTIGASNQKGTLRFGGAAVGGLVGLVALVYLFPNVETIGGFWLVFGAGTAVAAWVNFGTPRISYGGYQIGLAFYKAVLQGFGPALSATVVRDRLIGVFFGLIVFGIVEELLWPVRAQDALRARLAEMLRLLADLARSRTNDKTPTVIADDVDAWRRRIAQKVEDVQGLIESSKFESGDLELDEIQKRTGDAQIVFVLLLSLARQSRDIAQSNVVRAAEVELDSVIATALEALAMRAAGDSEPPVPGLEDALNGFDRSMAGTDALDKEAGTHLAGRLALYRTLVAAINRLSSGISEYRTRQTPESRLERGAFFESRQTRIN